MRCVGISQTQAKVTKKYTCPVCAAVRVSEGASGLEESPCVERGCMFAGRATRSSASNHGWGTWEVRFLHHELLRRITLQYNGEPLQAALAKLKKTRRPTRAGLGAFLEQASGG